MTPFTAATMSSKSGTSLIYNGLLLIFSEARWCCINHIYKAASRKRFLPSRPPADGSLFVCSLKFICPRVLIHISVLSRRLKHPPLHLHVQISERSAPASLLTSTYLCSTQQLLQQPVLSIELHVPFLVRRCHFFSWMLSTPGRRDVGSIFSRSGGVIWLRLCLRKTSRMTLDCSLPRMQHSTSRDVSYCLALSSREYHERSCQTLKLCNYVKKKKNIVKLFCNQHCDPGVFIKR